MNLKKILLILSITLLNAHATENKIGIFPSVAVKKEQIQDSKKYYARLSENEGSVYSLSVRADGYIQKLFVENNFTNVKKGEKLFSFFSPEILDAQSELLAASSNSYRQLAKEKLEFLGVDKKEIQKMLKTRTILNEITYYAPFSGIVFAKNFNVGSGVKKGNEVFRIVNLDTLWVVVSINQEDLEFLKTSQKEAFVEIEGIKNTKFPITLDTIYPNVVDNFLQARFILQNSYIDSQPTFFPNAFAYVSIQSPKREALTLPKQSVLYKNGKYFVFVKDNGEILPKQIQATRILGSQKYEILHGLDEGEEVVKNALFVVDSDAQNNGDFE